MKRFLVACIAVSVTGCGWLYGDEGIIRDRANEYLKAQTEPRMKIPEGVPPNSREQDYLSIPDLSQNAQQTLPAEFEVPAPPPLRVDQSDTPSGDQVSLNEMKTAAVDQANVADKYSAELIQNEQQQMVLKLTGRFEEVWDDIGETLKVTETEVIDLNRSTGTYYVKSDDVTVQLIIKEADGTVIVSVEEDTTPISNADRERMLAKIKEQLVQSK